MQHFQDIFFQFFQIDPSLLVLYIKLVYIFEATTKEPYSSHIEDMKKASVLLLLTAILSACTSTDKTFYLHGNFQIPDSETVYLICSNKVMDSTTVKDGEFSFQGDAAIPQIAYVADARTVRAAQHSCVVALEPGLLSVFPLTDGDGYYATGSKSNELITQYNKFDKDITDYYYQHKDEEGVDEEVDSKIFKELLDNG